MALELQPDLIFLTGDFFTAEAHRQADALSFALEPLKSAEGRVFACYGNHDLENTTVKLTVDRAVAACGAHLLCDEWCTVTTKAGPIDVVGLGYYRMPGERAEAMDAFFQKYRSASSSTGRSIVMLHDPSGFLDIPRGLGALVLSGHTHGGHIGLYSLGLHHWTLGRLVGMFDNGAWRGRGNVLYVHRGQGARSLMSQAVTRLGVPSEDSVMRVRFGKRQPKASAY
jgi:predicted MPP superfamily phosphohydrolase